MRGSHNRVLSLGGRSFMQVVRASLSYRPQYTSAAQCGHHCSDLRFGRAVDQSLVGVGRRSAAYPSRDLRSTISAERDHSPDTDCRSRATAHGGGAAGGPRALGNGLSPNPPRQGSPFCLIDIPRYRSGRFVLDARRFGATVA